MSSWEQEPMVSPLANATGDLVSGKKISPPTNVKKTKKIPKSKITDSSSSKMVDNPIWKYLRDIGNIPLLTRKRELEVANRAQTAIRNEPGKNEGNYQGWRGTHQGIP
jgi:hypothetical protein